jgi:hypothetical protein
MPKPAYESGFTNAEEGRYLFKISTIEFAQDDSEKKRGLVCKARHEIQEGIEHDDQTGISVLDQFPLYTNFGVSRLLGLGVKAGLPLDPDKDYPADYFSDEKIQQKWMKGLPERLFGGEVKHRPLLKDGKETGTKAANITSYFSKDEYKTKIKEFKEGGGKTSKGKPADTDFEHEKETGSTGTGTGTADDQW